MSHKILLRDLLNQSFNEADIRSLCFALSIEYENLQGLSKIQKIEDLILYCERVSLLDELVHICKKVRPKVTGWQNIQVPIVDEAVANEPSILRYHNLPQPIFNQFVGRTSEFEMLVKLLHPESGYSQIPIDGVGGVGKSTLAQHTAYYFLNNFNNLTVQERFEAIIWIPAQPVIFTADGPISRHHVVDTLEQIHSVIGIVLNRKDITRVKFEQQSELVKQALSRQRTLLIIDNFETIADEKILSFIHDLPLSTKTIITTRHPINLNNAYRINLKDMPDRDAFLLIHKMVNEKQLKLNDKETKQLFDISGGIPLIILWVVSQVGFGYEIDDLIDQFNEDTSEATRFCFDFSVDTIRDQAEFTLLMALSLFPSGATKVALSQVTGLKGSISNQGLIKLARLSLVNRNKQDLRKFDRFSILPITRSYCRLHLRKLSDLEIKLRNNMMIYVQELLEKYERNENNGEPIVIQELDNILDALDSCSQEGKYQDFIKIINLLGTYLWRQGRYNLLSKYYKQAYDYSCLIDDRFHQAEFLRLLANIDYFQGNLEEAIQRLKKSIPLYEPDYENHFGRYMAIFRLSAAQTRLGMLLKHQDRIDMLYEAESNAKWGLKLAEENNENRHTSRMHGRLGMIAVIREDIDAASDHFSKGVELYKATLTNDAKSWTLSWLYRWRGWTSAKRGYLLQAEEDLQLAMNVATGKQDIAETKQRYIEYYLLAGEVELAEQQALQTIEIFNSLGMTGRVEDINNLAAWRWK